MYTVECVLIDGKCIGGSDHMECSGGQLNRISVAEEYY